jgi:hypothetical protein
MKEHCKSIQQFEGVLQAFVAEFRSTASLYSSMKEYCKPL